MWSIGRISRALPRIYFSTTLKQLSSSSTSEMQYESRLSDMSKRREPSVLRELTKVVLAAPKETISFATGMPNPSTFPFAEVKVTLKDGEEFIVQGKELENALQYQPSTGYTELRKLLQDIQDNEHGPQDWSKKSVLVSSGSMDGISRAIDMLLNVGDPLIIQHPMYSGIESLLKPYQPTYILAEQDKDGVNPDILRQALEKQRKAGGKMPKVMYINPTGANPTGTTLTTDRKKQLYQLAQEYDLIILEDDAYFYLHFLEANPISFLSLDTDGRVIRFDSFSKILSSGLRLGIVTGPQDLLRQIELHIQSSTLQTSSMAQVMAYKLLRTWGPRKLQQHYQNIRNFYRDRRNTMLQAAQKHLTGLAEWTEPTGGMFLWIRVLNVEDTNKMVMERGIGKQIVLVPGRCFNANPSQPSPYIRAAFSLASEDEIDQGMARLADLIRQEQKLGGWT